MEVQRQYNKPQNTQHSINYTFKTPSYFFFFFFLVHERERERHTHTQKQRNRDRDTEREREREAGGDLFKQQLGFRVHYSQPAVFF
jgi:hypothetical protein